ncbi:MAG: flagellar hook protein FlgE [Bryobacteraceae bacterium]
MLTALSTALSALDAESTAIDVVGNNLANLNTTGFKANTTVFDDLISQTQGATGATQIGMGVAPPTTERIFTEGAIQASTGPLDVAIQGSGFLIVQPHDATTNLYTRAGNLKTDANGVLQDAAGDNVQGWTAVNGQVDTSGAIGNIVLPIGANRQPTATQNISLTMNLDATAPTYTATNPPVGSTFSTSVEVFDSKGQSYPLAVTFTNQGGNTWAVSGQLNGVTPPIPLTVAGGEDATATGSATTGNTGLLIFDANGNLQTTTSTTSGTSTTTTPCFNPISFTLSTATLSDSATFGNAGAVSLNLLDSNGNPTATEYAQKSAVSAPSADGNAAANLTTINIADGGTIEATYSDGTQVAVGQLAMASFRNPDSLIAVGNNNYQVSGLTSNPAVGVPNSGGRGQILGSSLEASTVDIAQEFTNLIVFQRSYQANSKVVTTTDQINQDTISIIQ